jgi:hypothetical protein
MPPSQLDFSNYESLLEVLQKSDPENAYNDLMTKEDKVLGSVNAIVNEHKARKSNESQFLHMSLYQIYNIFFLEFRAILKELPKAKDLKDYVNIFMAGDRIIYIGVFFVILSVLIFFIDSSIGTS